MRVVESKESAAKRKREEEEDLQKALEDVAKAIAAEVNTDASAAAAEKEAQELAAALAQVEQAVAADDAQSAGPSGTGPSSAAAGSSEAGPSWGPHSCTAPCLPPDFDLNSDSNYDSANYDSA